MIHSHQVVITVLAVIFFYFIFIVYTITDVLSLSSFAHLPLFSLPPSLWPSSHCCLCIWVICTVPSPSFIQLPFLPTLYSCQSIPCIYASASILSVSLFCLLDSTYVRSYGICLSLMLISLSIIYLTS